MSPNMRDSLRLPEPMGKAVEVSRLRVEPPCLKINDPAVSVMSDFTHEAPCTINEDYRIDDALDEMFRLGVRALLVTREQQVVGLLTADTVKDERYAAFQTDSHDCGCRDALCVADVMTDAGDIPAIDWTTVLDATLKDLLEIFEGSNVNHLVVLESDNVAYTRVRGLIHRSRLDRQLRGIASL